jgi:hypothetical protein
MRSPDQVVRAAGIAGLASLLLVASCGGKDHAPARPRLPDAPALTAYPALAFVPAEPDAVMVVQHAADITEALRPVVELGALVMGGREDVGDMLRGELGFDPLDLAALGDRGLEVGGSIAIYLQGTGVTAVLPARDAGALTATIQELVGAGAHEAVVDGVTVSTSVGRGPTIAWAADGPWVWVHVELGRGTDGAWLAESRAAAGAYALDPDLAWATGADTSSTAPAPMAAIARLDRVLAGPARLVAGMMGKRCLGHISTVQRLGVRGAIDDRGALSLRAAADIDDTSAVAAALAPEPRGWAQVGARPGLVGALNLDARALAELASACVGDDVREMVDELGLERGRLFVDDLSVKGLAGNLGLALETSHQTWTRWLIDQIPGRSFLEQKTQFGDIAGYVIDVPIFGKHSFAISDDRFMAGKGSGFDLAKLAGAPGAAATNLGHAALRPGKFTDDTWRYVLGMAGVDGREASTIVAILRAWDLLAVDASITPGEIVLTLDAAPAS